MRERIGQYRKTPLESREDPVIGCIILTEPFWFTRPNWIPVPQHWSPNIVQGKGYDLREEIGKSLRDEVLVRRAASVTNHRVLTDWPIDPDVSFAIGLAKRRLGQGAFRVGITELYGKRCAVTGERTLPVLDAAHIQPVADDGNHSSRTGLFLRSDVHTLFDRGYVTVNPDYRFNPLARRE